MTSETCGTSKQATLRRRTPFESPFKSHHNRHIIMIPADSLFPDQKRGPLRHSRFVLVGDGALCTLCFEIEYQLNNCMGDCARSSCILCRNDSGCLVCKITVRSIDGPSWYDLLGRMILVILVILRRSRWPDSWMWYIILVESKNHHRPRN